MVRLGLLALPALVMSFSAPAIGKVVAQESRPPGFELPAMLVALPTQSGRQTLGAIGEYTSLPFQFRRICKPLLQGALPMRKVAPLLRSMGYTIIPNGPTDPAETVTGKRKRIATSPSVIFRVEPRHCDLSTRSSLNALGDVFAPWRDPADGQYTESATNPGPDQRAFFTDNKTFVVTIGSSFGRARATAALYR